MMANVDSLKQCRKIAQKLNWMQVQADSYWRMFLSSPYLAPLQPTLELDALGQYLGAD